MFYDFVSLEYLTADDILDLLSLADELKAMHKRQKSYRPLEGQSVAMIFEKPSLRTRVTFEAGIFQLGGQAISVGADTGKLGERESVPDVARNLERWVDGVVARTYSHDAVDILAANASIPVINALTDKMHPCQVLADVQTLRERKGRIEELKVAFVGDGNNVAASWLHFAAHIPIQFALICPPGYEADREVVAFAQKRAGGNIQITNDVETGLRDADAVYTDVWTSMGQENEQREREKAFQPYQVNARLMSLAKPDAVFMHCLPAKRGKEVTDDVMDGPQCVVFDQAENRLHTQKAILVTLLKRDRDNLNRKQRYQRGV